MAGRKPASGILGVNPDLDGVAALPDIGLHQPQRVPFGNPQLILDEIAAGHRLGHRVLHLEPRVHLEEEELAAIGQQELDRPGTHVADVRGKAQGGGPHPLADLRRDRGSRRLLHDLLVAPLGAAVALAQVDAVALGVEEHLDLDVPRPYQEALQDEPIVTEGPRCLAPCRGECLGKILGVRARPACPCRRRRRRA